MNIVELLGITYKEDIISNLLIGLLNESNNFKDTFLKNIVEIFNPEDYTVKANARIATSVGIPDIVVIIENQNEIILLIIENKLKADEGDNQTLRYSKPECINELINKLEVRNCDRTISTKLLFLTLIPEQVPTGNEFINITYKDLLEKVNCNIEDEGLNRIYSDFLTLMNEFYYGLEVREDDNLLDILSGNFENEKVFIKFRNIIRGIKINNGLKIINIGKTGGLGRLSFIVQISKDDWCGKETAEFVNNMYTVNEETYDIHIEGSFDILNKNITLPLHYETTPYIPKQKLIKNTNPQDYECYLKRRGVIKTLVHNNIKELKDDNIKPYNGSNQIASIKLDVNESTTVKEFRQLLEENIDKFSDIVDSALDMLKSYVE